MKFDMWLTLEPKVYFWPESVGPLPNQIDSKKNSSNVGGCAIDYIHTSKIVFL